MAKQLPRRGNYLTGGFPRMRATRICTIVSTIESFSYMNMRGEKQSTMTVR